LIINCNWGIGCRCHIEDEYCPLHDCLCTEIKHPGCPIHKETPKRYYKPEKRLEENTKSNYIKMDHDDDYNENWNYWQKACWGKANIIK